MAPDVSGQIAWASQFYTLSPGDIIMSGTCDGMSRVQPSDVKHLEFENIGVTDVPVSAAYSRSSIQSSMKGMLWAQ